MIVLSSFLFHLFLIQICTGVGSRMLLSFPGGLVEACPEAGGLSTTVATPGQAAAVCQSLTGSPVPDWEPCPVAPGAPATPSPSNQPFQHAVCCSCQSESLTLAHIS